MDTIGNFGNAGEGNTKPRVIQGKYWTVVVNNWSKETLDTMETTFRGMDAKYGLTEEIAPTTGTRHLQGFVQFKKPVRAPERFKEWKAHWEKCKGNEQQNLDYIHKTVDKGSICHTNIKIKRKPKILKVEQLYPWQLELVEILKKEPDDRTIHWYWSEDGLTGKSTFCKYLSAEFAAIPLEGKKNDILYCAAQFESDVYVWDLERSMEDFVSYGALEKIKNGYFMCSKYESMPIIRACPHVVVFANFAPDRGKLSKDRWHIVNIGPHV